MTIKDQIGVGDIKLQDLEKKYLLDVIESNRLSYGKYSEKFESLFAKDHECKYAIFCNSGTSALHVSLAAMKEKYGWNDGDEVIVPAVTFVATSNIVIHNNMKPVFVDIDPKTYNIDPRLIEEKITERTRCIIPVHLFGMPCDMEPIMKIASKHGLRILEDSCETMFAKYKGNTVGSFGDMACFSTYIAHFLVTGVGGLVTTNDPELAIIARSLINHGRDSIYLKIDDDKNVDDASLFEIVSRRFNFVRMGHSFRCTELEAAIGLAQLERKDEIIRARRSNAAFFIQNIGKHKQLQMPFVPEDREHNFMMFPIVVREGSKIDLVNFLEKNNIETRDLMPLITQPAYSKLIGKENYPVASYVSSNGFYIACHQHLTEEQKNHIVKKFDEYFDKY